MTTPGRCPWSGGISYVFRSELGIICERTSEGDTGTGSWGLVHLAVHQSALGLVCLVTGLDDTALNHLAVQVVTLTRALANTGEHGEASVSLGHVVDQLHNEHSLADTSTAEESDLATALVGGQEVNHLWYADRPRAERVSRAHTLRRASMRSRRM